LAIGGKAISKSELRKQNFTPKIFEYLGYVFFFYANEHLPIYIQFSVAEFESKIVLIYQNVVLKELKIQTIKGRTPLNESDLKVATKFVKKYHKQIISKWTNFFVLNKKLTC
jgi:hypothetical protein